MAGADRFQDFVILPANGATDVALRPTLQFNCDDSRGGVRGLYVEAVTNIRFLIDGAPVFADEPPASAWGVVGDGYKTSGEPTTPFASSVLNYDLTEAQELEKETSYTYAVQIKDVSGGDTYATVISGTFTTIGGTPNKAYNPVPSNGNETDGVFDYRLSWTNGSDTDDVEISIGTVSGSLSSIAAEVTTTYYDVDSGDFPEDAVVYWRIDSSNDVGTTTGDEWQFDPRVEVATNPTPSDGATSVSVTQSRLYWDAGNKYQTFDVYIDEVLVASDLTTEYYELSSWGSWPLEYDTEYTWKVDSKNVHSSEMSDTWTLNTGSEIVAGSTRPDGYDPDAIWDTSTTSWITDDSVFVAGGGRYQSQIIVIGHNVIYFGSI